MNIKSGFSLFKRKLGSESLSGGIFWNFVGNILARTSNLVVSIFVAYFLTKEEYGQLGFLRSTMSTFVIFGTFGFGVAATKFFADGSYEEEKGGFGIVLRLLSSIISLIVALILFYFSKEIAISMGGGVVLDFPIKIISISLFFLSLNSVQTGILVGLKKFKNTAKAISISSILAAFVTIYLTKYYKLEGYAWGISLGAFLNWAICLWYLNRFDIKWRIQKNNIKRITFSVLKISVPAILSGIIVLPITWYSNSIIINTEGGLESLGTYNAVYNISAITLAIINIFGQAVLPFAIQNYNKSNKRFEIINYYTPWLIGIFLSLPLILIPEINFLIYGEKYSGSEVFYVSIVIALSTILISQRQGIAKNFLASGKMWISFLGNIVWGAILLVALVNLKQYSALGYSLSFLIAYFLNTIIFIPIYIKLKLIDRYLIYSKSALFLVIILLIASISALFFSIYVRIAILIVLFIFLSKIFYNLILSKSAKIV